MIVCYIFGKKFGKPINRFVPEQDMGRLPWGNDRYIY